MNERNVGSEDSLFDSIDAHVEEVVCALSDIAANHHLDLEAIERNPATLDDETRAYYQSLVEVLRVISEQSTALAEAIVLERRASFDETAYQLDILPDRMNDFLDRVSGNLPVSGDPLERKDGDMLLKLIEIFVDNHKNPESALDQVNRLLASLIHPSNTKAAEVMDVPPNQIGNARGNLAVAMAKSYAINRALEAAVKNDTAS